MFVIDYIGVTDVPQIVILSVVEGSAFPSGVMRLQTKMQILRLRVSQVRETLRSGDNVLVMVGTGGGLVFV